MRESGLVGWGLAVSACVTLLPFLLLCPYWHPVGTHAVDWISNWGGRYDGLSWWAQQVDWYQTTMGRYTSTALLSTTYYWYSLPVARLLILGLHMLLGAAVYYCVSGLFRAGWRDHAVLTLVVLALYLSQLSNPYDSLYRLTGLLIYQTGLIATLVLGGLLCRNRIGLAGLVVVFATGTNEITLLQCGLLLLGFTVHHRGRRRGRLWGLWVVAGVSAAVALLAPGNWVRAEFYQGQGRPLLEVVGLVVGTGLFTWLVWLSSTVLLPLIVLGGSLLPRLELSRPARWTIGSTAVLLPFLSFAPVLLATHGESFPEGIADWQIVPVALMISVLVAGVPRWQLSAVTKGVLVVFVGLSMLLGGLGLNRARDSGIARAIDRIVLLAPPGRAWRQLLSGRAFGYSRSVERQYAEVRACTADSCLVSPLQDQVDNYLYDPSYDRRIRPGGDRWFGYLVNQHPTGPVSPVRSNTQ